MSGNESGKVRSSANWNIISDLYFVDVVVAVAVTVTDLCGGEWA